MSISKGLFCAMVLVLALLFSACSNPPSAISINAKLEEYSKNQSSVPGLPLEAVAPRELKNKDLCFHWISEEGTFLKYHNNSKVVILGDDVRTSEHQIYWTANADEKISQNSFWILLTVENIATEEVLASTRLEIRQTDEGVFAIGKNSSQ